MEYRSIGVMRLKNSPAPNTPVLQYSSLVLSFDISASLRQYARTREKDFS